MSTKKNTEGYPLVKTNPVKVKSKGGASTLLTPEVQAGFFDLLRVGNYTNNACAAMGISEENFYNWMRRGEDEADRLKLLKGGTPMPNEDKYLQFFQSVKEAKARSRSLLHGVIIKEAFNGDWKAAAWMLSRTSPDQYSEKVQAELSTKVSNPVEIQVSIADIEKKIAAVIAQRKK